MLKKRSSYPQPLGARYAFTQDNIHILYELTFMIKNDIKTTVYHYKIIHNILPTKVSLFKAMICDDDKCPQCLADKHSIDHMFLGCQLT